MARALACYSCASEDVLRNGNGVLDAGIPLSVTASGLSDAPGVATVTISYPRNDANWMQLIFSVSTKGTVSGTEASATAQYRLATVPRAFSECHVLFPEQTSRYGSGPFDSAD